MENNTINMNSVNVTKNSMGDLIGPIDIVVFAMFFILLICMCRELYKKTVQKEDEKKIMSVGVIGF